MKKPFETPFTDINRREINSVPDYVVENMNILTEKILRIALWDEDNKTRIHPSLSLAAMQKALSLLISQFFPEDKVPEIADKIISSIKFASLEFAKIDLSKEPE